MKDIIAFIKLVFKRFQDFKSANESFEQTLTAFAIVPIQKKDFDLLDDSLV